MPQVGDMAPDFELKSHLEKDKKVKLSDFRGQKKTRNLTIVPGLG